LEASKDPRAITVRKPALQIVFNYHPEGYDPLNPPAEQQPTAPASTPTNEKKTAPAEPAKPGAKPPRPAAKVNTFISSRTGQRVPYETDEEGEDLI